MTPDTATRRDAVLAGRVGRYERMVEIRLIEEAVLDLFAQGLISGTTHTSQGQEAVAVAVAAATRPGDHVACTYRGHGIALALGMTPAAVLGEILGRQAGCISGMGGSMHLSDPAAGLLPTFAIVGAGIPVAVGAALSAQVRGTSDVALAVFGDGAANIGAFHEALNLAAVWRLPVVFVCENNMYGEYSRIDKTTSVQDIADRAAAYRIPGEVVDGQDPDVLLCALAAAVQRARAGEGPTLVEAKTYRFAGHSRSDQALYRPPGELESWLERDPLTLFGNKLVQDGELGPEDRAHIYSRQQQLVAASLEVVLASPAPTIDMMMAGAPFRARPLER
jgi:TPP-dependent pyruvate/acetoin dehydrogenase alpha subunit